MWLQPAAIEVTDRLIRALAVLRVVVLLNALVLNVYRWANFEHPEGAVVVLTAMTGWTGVVIWGTRSAERRRPWLLVADLAVAVAAMASTPLLKGPEFNATVPGFWVMGALMAWAVQWRWRGGLLAAAALSATDLAIRPELTQTNYGNVFLLMIGGPIVGSMCESLQRSAVARDEAERAAAAAAERSRLARVVHDGVLQVLALVQRRSSELGGELAELGRLAGEQEAALRSLIRQQDAISAPSDDATVDLCTALGDVERRSSPRVHLVTPGAPVHLGAAAAAEVLAVVGACLDNVTHHVGAEADAWVLLEDLEDQIIVGVRDDGPGIPPGRLDQAVREGRLGVAESIRGRIRDLGGTATLNLDGFGTEWEFTVPK